MVGSRRRPLSPNPSPPKRPPPCSWLEAAGRLRNICEIARQDLLVIFDCDLDVDFGSSRTLCLEAHNPIKSSKQILVFPNGLKLAKNGFLVCPPCEQ